MIRYPNSDHGPTYPFGALVHFRLPGPFADQAKLSPVTTQGLWLGVHLEPGSCYHGGGKKKYPKTKTYNKTHIFIFEEDVDKLPDILNIAKTGCGDAYGAKSGPKKRIVTVQIDKTSNQIINTFESGYDASKKLKFKYTGINQCCNYHKYTDEDRPKCYKLKTYNGFIFKQIVE